MSEQETTDEFTLDDLLDDLGATHGPETPEEKLYRELTEGKYPKLHNCIYWMKHELHTLAHLQNKNWIISKLNGPNRVQVSHKEIARALLEYYFQMTNLPRFSGEDAIRRGTAVDMVKFLDKIMEEPTLKKLIENPTLLI